MTIVSQFFDLMLIKLTHRLGICNQFPFGKNSPPPDQILSVRQILPPPILFLFYYILLPSLNSPFPLVCSQRGVALKCLSSVTHNIFFPQPKSHWSSLVGLWALPRPNLPTSLEGRRPESVEESLTHSLFIKTASLSKYMHLLMAPCSLFSLSSLLSAFDWKSIQHSSEPELSFWLQRFDYKLIHDSPPNPSIKALHLFVISSLTIRPCLLLPPPLFQASRKHPRVKKVTTSRLAFPFIVPLNPLLHNPISF